VLASAATVYGPNRRTALPGEARSWCCLAQATCTGGRQRSWCWHRSGSPATEPSGPVTNLDPLNRLQPIPAAHWAHGGLGGVKVRPCSPSDRAAGQSTNRAHSKSKRPSSGCNGVHILSLYPPTWRSLPHPRTASSPLWWRPHALGADQRLGAAVLNQKASAVANKNTDPIANAEALV
jgi:hypothetical protein